MKIACSERNVCQAGVQKGEVNALVTIMMRHNLVVAVELYVGLN